MLRGLFVTGTDTGVGKTVLAAALLHRFRAAAPLRYWKPVQTGIEQDDDTETVRRLGEASPEEICPEGVRLRRPVSPHLAARLSGAVIEVEPLARIAESRQDGRCWLVEGAGGVLVPLNDTETMAGLIERLGLAVVVAARSTLGTINHTLLTLEALRRRSLEVAGVVMMSGADAENRAAIERFGGVPVLGEAPVLSPLGARQLRGWTQTGLDPDGTLLRFFHG